MKAVLAILIALLSAIESFLLALLFISLLVSPGGSGEFTGINHFAGMLYAFFFLPGPTWVIVFILVMRFHTPENHKDFRRFAWGLAAAVAMVPIVSVFTASPYWAPPLALGVNAAVLTLWTIVILWRRVTQEKDDSFQASA